jgi:hypothetical protein
MESSRRTWQQKLSPNARKSLQPQKKNNLPEEQRLYS